MNFYELAQQMNPSYTAIVLDEKSRAKLLSMIPIPAGWEEFAHHMTINMGAADKGPASSLLGNEVQLVANTFAQDETIGVMAVGVETDIPSSNQIKHITLAVNRAVGAKPFFSNKLQNWVSMTPIPLTGVVAEVAQGGRIIR
jgi:hypothetical protein|tara:strand:- start:135 stop:560 length:426 start_codon:yes stop_codon:yes gene_type:complete